MLVNHIDVKGRRIKTGDTFTLNLIAENHSDGWDGLGVRIGALSTSPGNEGGPGTKIGIIADERSDHFHTLDGMAPERKGYWLTLEEAFAYLDLVQLKQQYIISDVIYRKTNLKGMKCNIISSIGENDYMVELEEDIGGSSGDGMGKKGHCIPVPTKIVGSKATKEKQKKTSGKGKNKKK